MSKRSRPKRSSKLPVDTGPPVQTRPNVHLNSVLALAVVCDAHQTIGLRQMTGRNELWLPFGSINDKDSWNEVATLFAKKLLGPTIQDSHLRFTSVYHTQVSRKGIWLKRVIYTVRLRTPDLCCQKISSLKWLPCDELISNIDDVRIWGSEPSFFSYVLKTKTGVQVFVESHLNEANEMQYDRDPKTQKLSAWNIMLKQSTMSFDDAVLLAEDFYTHIYPSQNMNLRSFQEYFSSIGWSRDPQKLTRMYNSFRAYDKDNIRLRSFLYGIAAYATSTPHSGIALECRLMTIFRYFDDDRSGFLELPEFFNLRKDVLQANKVQTETSDVVNELSYDYEDVNVQFGNRVALDQLKAAVTNMRFRGTSGLCRSKVSIRGKRLYSSDHAIAQNNPAVRCPRHGKVHYGVETMEVNFDANGKMTGVNPVQPSVLTGLTEDQKRSSEMLLTENAFQKCIAMVHHHAEAVGIFTKKHNLPRHDWERCPDDHFNERMAIITEVLRKAKEMFLKEPPIIKLASPIYVMGDIHGNLKDLMTFESVLWRKGPAEPGNFLFLGDYVDRGKDSMECILYLFCLKITNPKKFTLLRGNHEVRSLQKSFTFLKEVIHKLSRNGKFHDRAEKIWDAFNDVFDSMPLCAVIDDSLFCAHGGIPFSATKLQQLLSIPKQMPNPEEQSPPAWEMLWNDPSEKSDALNTINLTAAGSSHKHLENLRGYLPNEKRGTAYLYTDIAVNKYLAENGLSHIIRAHEVIPDGYRYQMGGKVTTVFSSSRYCGQNNKAACILCVDGKMRVIRIDT